MLKKLTRDKCKYQPDEPQDLTLSSPKNHSQHYANLGQLGIGRQTNKVNESIPLITDDMKMW